MNRNNVLGLLICLLAASLLPAGSAAARSAPYLSIHGASYQALGAAEQHIKSLQDKGYESFYERVDIPGKGKWYRIYIGRYDNKEAAQKAADSLKASKMITDFTIRQVMLPAARAVKAPPQASPKTSPPPKKKTTKSAGKRFDIAASAIDPDARKLAKSRTEAIAARPATQQNTAAQPGAVAPSGAGTAGGQPETPPAAPPKTDPKAAPEGGSLLDLARSELKAQRYEQAAAMVKNYLSQPSLPEALRGQALRLAADCDYFLGQKGDPKILLTVVEQYKTILMTYPDPAAGNDLVYYYLAKCNEKLSFFYEATGAWDRLISTYPESAYGPEAMFQLGSLLTQMGKYNRALERLLAYVKKYPAGEYAKTAHYMIGDCYYLLHKEEFAGQWYDAARKQWPDFQGIPVKTIMNMANHYFTARQFSSSLQVVSLYYNLYPEDEFGKKALFMMARNAEAMGQTAMALQFYRLYIEKYPADAEAETCLIAMAALGVAKPGIKFPVHVLPMDAYQSPLPLLESLLAKKPGGEKEAALLLTQGDALVKLNRLPEGLASYQALVSRFPRAKSSDEARKKLTSQARSLVNESYEKGDYLAIADVYFRGYGQDVAPRDDFNTAIRVGDSLLMTGLYDEAAAIYEALKKIYPDRARESIIVLAQAKIDVAKNRDGAAEEKLLALLSAGGVKNPALRNDTKATLANLYYKKGLPAKANPLYAEALQAGGGDQGRLYRNYGRSLQAAKLPDQAIANYLKALKDFQQRPKSYPADVLTDIYGGLGDAYFDVKRYPEGIEAYRQALARAGEEDGEVRKWLTYMIGKGATELRDFAGAQKSFASVKANAAGDFWPKVADYSLERSRARENAGNQNE